VIEVATVAALREARAGLPDPVGFVPTMGYLHAGHLALVQAAREQNAAVIASIFVNPTQFGPNEDYQSYPRDLARDRELLQAAGVDLLFAPPVAEMYPPGFTTAVDVGPLAERLEGASRPGHFRGVATVVARLFNLVQPRRAYFGQKDAQQVVVVNRLAADLGFPLEIVAVPIVREADGLALSSRNVYLQGPERLAARCLSAALRTAAVANAAGTRDAAALRRLVRDRVGQEPLARLDYVSVADPVSLDEIEGVARPALLSLAVWIGRTRLIDNVILD
jgi:pantoate--beta-alanine ligase